MSQYKLLCLLLACMTAPAAAQFRIHDAKREAAALEAKKLADRIRAGETFKRQTQNLQILREQDVATTVADARLEMQTAINSLHQWSDVAELASEFVNAPKGLNAEEVESRKKAHAETKAALQAQIATLRAEALSDSGELSLAMARVGDIRTALAFAENNLGLDGQAVRDTLQVLQKLQVLYKDYETQFSVVNKAEQRLRELKIDLKRALIARLKVEEEFLLTQVALHARAEAELKAVRLLANECAVPAGIIETESIAETLNRLANDRPKLELAVGSLYACSSLAAKGKLPGRLLQLRKAQLEHLRSIQLSAANARIYESILSGGVERLALFYQGGVKPETLAQIIQSLSTAGIFGKLLTQ